MFKNRVILITGGASGLGFVVAQGLAGHGAELIVTGASQEQIDRAVPKLGFYATGIVADTSKVVDLHHLFSRIKTTHGRLDVLVVSTVGGREMPLGEITENAFDQLFETNVKGVAFTVQAALPMMEDGGSIVIIGDHAPVNGRGGLSLFRATKSALHSLVEEWLTDLKQIGVRVNMLSATSSTPPKQPAMVTPNGEHVFCALKNRWMFEQGGSQYQIGKAAAFLASDASRYLNGVELFADL